MAAATQGWQPVDGTIQRWDLVQIGKQHSQNDEGSTEMLGVESQSRWLVAVSVYVVSKQM